MCLLAPLVLFGPWLRKASFHKRDIIEPHPTEVLAFKKGNSDVIMPPPQEKTFSDAMRNQMADRKFASLNKYVGKYEYGDAKGRLFGQQDHLGIEIRPDGTYSRNPGKGGWDGTYSIRKNKLLLHGYSWKRRTAKANLNGRILIIEDKSEYRGSVILVKTWPIKGVHY